MVLSEKRVKENAQEEISNQQMSMAYQVDLKQEAQFELK